MSGSTSYPLATLAPAVGVNGITAVQYNDILLSLQASYQSIFGTDTVLTADSQDGQWLAIIAQAISDMNQAIVATYNNFSPATAVGAGLSSVVKVNGITRAVPTNSEVILTLIGQAGAVINNGLVGDNQNLGTQWALPSTVTIPLSGTINVTATCITQGAIAAGANTLTTILTPTAGWQSVTNQTPAVLGAPVETDAGLRRRQTESTMIPSQTVMDGIVGAVLALPGVVSAEALENPTAVTDPNGFPPHSFSIVVQGGSVQSIVNTIGLKKTPGTQTYGNISGVFIDQYNKANTIFYTVPSSVSILVNITVKALPGYTSAIGQEIQAAVVGYINSLGIGQSVYISKLYVPANLYGPYAAPASTNDTNTYEVVSISASISPNVPIITDVLLAYNQQATTSLANVAINITI